jgi:hypothetical protein
MKSILVFSNIREYGYTGGMSDSSLSRLRRPVQPMPDFVREALVERNLMDAYQARPPYQRNDYLSWINRAKRGEKKLKRLDIMLDELKRGEGYMGQPYKQKDNGVR